MNLARLLLFPEPTDGGGTPANPATITIPKEQYQSFLDAQAAARTLSESNKALQGQLAENARANAVIEATSGAKFRNPAAQKQAMQLLSGQFMTETDATGTIRVLDRTTRRPAGEVVAELLKAPDFAHFLEASHQGGAPPGNTHQSYATGSPLGGDTQVENLGEALVLQFQQAQAAARAAGPGDMSQPRFLRPV